MRGAGCSPLPSALRSAPGGPRALGPGDLPQHLADDVNVAGEAGIGRVVGGWRRGGGASAPWLCAAARGRAARCRRRGGRPRVGSCPRAGSSVPSRGRIHRSRRRVRRRPRPPSRRPSSFLCTFVAIASLDDRFRDAVRAHLAGSGLSGRRFGAGRWAIPASSPRWRRGGVAGWPRRTGCCRRWRRGPSAPPSDARSRRAYARPAPRSTCRARARSAALEAGDARE